MKRVVNTLKTNSNTAGFTLIELLVIIIIVGILAAILAPTWLSFLNRQRVGTVRSDLLQTIKQAQQDAIQRRQTVSLEFTNTDDGYPAIDRGIEQVLGSGSGLRPDMVALLSYYIDDEDGPESDVNISFDYQGKPINEEAVDFITGTSTDLSEGEGLPFVISVSDQNASEIQCVIIANLIGSLKTAEGEDCALPDVEIDPAGS